MSIVIFCYKSDVLSYQINCQIAYINITVKKKSIRYLFLTARTFTISLLILDHRSRRHVLFHTNSNMKFLACIIMTLHHRLSLNKQRIISPSNHKLAFIQFHFHYRLYRIDLFKSTEFTFHISTITYTIAHEIWGTLFLNLPREFGVMTMCKGCWQELTLRRDFRDTIYTVASLN